MVESIVDVEAPRVVDNLLKGWRMLYPREDPGGEGAASS